MTRENLDEKVVKGFGDEWSRFDQSTLSEEELGRMLRSTVLELVWRKDLLKTR